MQSGMQTASSRIWTQIADSISYNDNYYAKHTSSYGIKYFYLIQITDLFDP